MLAAPAKNSQSCSDATPGRRATPVVFDIAADDSDIGKSPISPCERMLRACSCLSTAETPYSNIAPGPMPPALFPGSLSANTSCAVPSSAQGGLVLDSGATGGRLRSIAMGNLGVGREDPSATPRGFSSATTSLTEQNSADLGTKMSNGSRLWRRSWICYRTKDAN